MSNVTKPLLLDETFSKKMDITNGLLAVIAREGAPSSTDWAYLEELASEGVFGTMYDIGTTFSDIWRDTAASTDYTFPWELNHLGAVELQDGEILQNRPWLQMRYAHPFGVQFSHQRAFTVVAFKVTTALTAGTTYYWTRQSDSKTISFKCPTGGISVGQWLVLNNSRIEIYDTNANLVSSVAATIGTDTAGTSLGNSPILAAGDYYFTSSGVKSFTLASQLEFGDRLGYWSSKVYPVTGDGKTIGTGLTVGSATTGTDLGSLSTNTRKASGDYLLNGSNEMNYAWNRWKTSAMRQYLNSEDGVGSWWKSQDAFDIAPDQLTTKAGFLYCYKVIAEDTTKDPAVRANAQAFLDSIKTIKVVTYPNTVQDDTGGNTPDITYDRVFLPSLEQMYITPQKSGEGEYHERWKRQSGLTSPMAQGGTYPQIRTYAVENHSSAQHVRLRSAGRGSSCDAWIVYSSGYVYGDGAYYAYRFSPLVVL